MKRALFIVLCLLLGAMITVGTAWWFGATGSPDGRTGTSASYPSDLGWPLPAPEGWPLPTAESAISGPGMGIRHADAHTVVNSKRVTHTMTVMGYGWPLHALRVRTAGVTTGGTNAPVWSGPLREGLAPPRFLNRGPQSFNRLALEPLWPGFAADAAVYGGPIWLAGVALLALRRGIRRRRGCCTRCAYELAGLAACPECGLAAPGNTKD